MPANHSNTNRVITILIYSDKTQFQNVFVMLLRRVAKDVTSSLLSWHKHYNFNAPNFRRHSQWKCALQTLWIRIFLKRVLIGCRKLWNFTPLTMISLNYALRISLDTFSILLNHILCTRLWFACCQSSYSSRLEIQQVLVGSHGL